MGNSSSKQILLSVLGVAILVVAVVGVSFAAFTFSKQGTVENTISTGTLTMNYTEETPGIDIKEAMPMTDEAGKALTGEGKVFDFTVTASISGAATINYEIAAIKKTVENAIADKDIRLYLEKSTDNKVTYTQSFAPAAFVPITSATEVGSPVGSMVLESGQFTTPGLTTNNYRLRMWLAEDAPINETSQSYTVTVNVYGKA